MFKRILQSHLLRLARQFPVISVVGPRQSGKTTLVQLTFPDALYVTLEDPDERAFAQEDPRGFLARFDSRTILDEVQRVPELFSYLQGIVDKEKIPGKWILTGSQNFLLMEKVAQSLAGRVAITKLFPLSMQEILEETNTSLHKTWHTFAHKGFFPQINFQPLDTADWYRSYIQTYVERDMRNILQLGNLNAFTRFIKLCASRSGQLLNYNNLAIEAGVSQPTAKKWISILESCGLILILAPHYNNFSKRVIKTPKLYWTDTGLLCHLLRIKNPEELLDHPFTGQIFETLVVLEFFKFYVHNCLEPDIFFWRDRHGHEVDLVVKTPSAWIPVEIKASATISSNFFKGLNFWLKLDNYTHGKKGMLVYAGEQEYVRSGYQVISWHNTGKYLAQL